MIWVVEAQNYVSLCGLLSNHARVLQKKGPGSPSFPLHVDEEQYHIKQVMMTSAQNNLKGEN